MMGASVVVVGSLNMDLVVQTPRLPAAGETLAGHGFTTAAGGKGANQAVAAARLGAQVAMVGCLGSDAYGDALRSGLLAEGIDCTAVATAEGVPTGIASILVDDQGRNTIVIVAGSNAELRPAQLAEHAALLAEAKVVITQLEVPMATVEATLQRTRDQGAALILNPAPATGPLPSHWYGLVDYLVPNESEASLLTGLPVHCPASARHAAEHLRGLGVARVLITLGEQGVLYAGPEGYEHYPAKPTRAVDTTAAGDTFLGGFAVGLAEGRPLAQAISLGQRAAGLAVTRAGAQPSIPYRHELPE